MRRGFLLLEQRATRNQALLDFVSSELYIEIAGEGLDQGIQPVIERPQCGKLSN